MAVLSPLNAVTNYQTGDAAMVALIGLRNVNTGDTLDISEITMPKFQVVKRAVVLGISDFVEIAATWTGTVVTMPSGLTADSAYLLIWGC
jgi:hypothetical protein